MGLSRDVVSASMERNGKNHKKLPGKPPLCNLLVTDVPATRQPGLARQL